MAKLNGKHITVLIPCLNEVKTIPKVIENARKYLEMYTPNSYQIIVADNGSTDGTVEKIKNDRRITLIKVPIKGYGAALHYGILYAKYQNVLFADADGSYNFSFINKFIFESKKDYDLILGSRLKGNIEKGAMPFLNRYLGTPLLTFLIRLIYAIPASDCNSGMRMINKRFYKKLHMNNSGMEWASELLIKTALKKGVYREVPINFYKDKRRRPPHLKRWEDGWRHLKVILLLKPTLLLLFFFFFFFLGIIELNYSLFNAIAMFLFSEFILFSFFITIKIDAAVNKTTSFINTFLESMPMLVIGIILNILVISLLFLISDNHLFTKYILLFQIILFNIWLYFNETINTHIVNSLQKNE